MSEPGARLGSFGGGNGSRLRAFGARYTWFVRITKIALPLLALAMVAFVVTRLSHTPQQLQLADLPHQEKTTPGQSELITARYEGVDDQNRPYVVTADRAVRDMSTTAAVALENPKGTMTLENNGWIKLEAAKGFYDNTAGKLKLSEGVKISHSSGYEISLQDADVDIRARHAITLSPVKATGPIGDITAQNLEVTQSGDLLIFGGPALLTIRQLHGKVPG